MRLEKRDRAQWRRKLLNFGGHKARAAHGCNRCIIYTCVLAKKVGGAHAPSPPLVATPMEKQDGNLQYQGQGQVS